MVRGGPATLGTTWHQFCPPPGLERDVLDPQVVEAALVFALEQLTRADTGSAARREDLRTELVRIEAELARYAEAIADAGPLDTILQAIKVREARRDAIRQELKVFALQRPGEPDAKEIRATLGGLPGRLDGDD